MIPHPGGRHHHRRWRARGALGVLALSVGLLAGCPTVVTTPQTVRSPKAQKWFERATREYRAASVDAAHASVRKALDIVPDDDGVKVLAARIALARLELDEALRLLEGVGGAQALRIRARAYWYQGEMEQTAKSLDELLDNPDVDDAWARQINKLAARGAGRKPFDVTTTEGRLESVQMAKVAGAPLFVVPLEIDGDKGLAVVATGNAEVMLDATTRSEPSWVSLRFGKRLEVRDVPALTEDLSEISLRLGAPIKALLGANLLRHLNVTLDHAGRQFVARDFVPPPPPVASKVDVFYLSGGGMVLGGALGDDASEPASLFVDSSMAHAVALDEAGWKKVGLTVDKLESVGGATPLKVGNIPLMQFGSFRMPKLPAILGTSIGSTERALDVDIDGAIGAALLSNFRLTFSDRGRILWVEQLAPSALGGGAPSSPGGAAPPTGPPAARPPTGLPGVPSNGVLVPGAGDTPALTPGSMVPPPSEAPSPAGATP
ncbi:MAG: hypothetical protein AAGN82_02820 [Myxococcota bacterium]